MTVAKSTDEDEEVPTPTPPLTPRRPATVKARRRSSAAKPATPINNTATPDGDTTPNTAPAGRPRAVTAKHQPTLLTDFLLGRPTPARVAADREAARKRRASLDIVKQEMRQAAIRRVQQPGGVQERVKKWQKANAQALVGEDPFSTPSEPSEVLIQVDDQSVTEEDRVRIKLRQKKKPPPAVIVVEKTTKTADDEEKENEEAATSASPPKKRVVSDTNWMKNNTHKVTKKKSPPRSRSPKAAAKADNGGSPLPKGFLQRPTAQPNVANRVKAWASKVEIPDESLSKARARSTARSAQSGDDGIRITPMSSDVAVSSASSESTQKSKPSARSASSHVPRERDSAARSSSQHTRSDKEKGKKPFYDDGIRVAPLKIKKALPDDGIRIFPSKPDVQKDSDRTPRASEKQPSARQAGKQRARSPSEGVDVIEVIEDPDSDDQPTPTRQDSKRLPKVRRPAPQTTQAKSATMVSGTTGTETIITEITDLQTSISESTEQQTQVTGTTATEDVSDTESWSSASDDRSDMPSTVLPRNLADIPVGYSAFSELDLPAAPRRRPNAKRQSSFKGATSVLKKALEGGKKIIAEKVDPPKPVVNQPPSIENWLSGTVDPFVETASSIPTELEPEKPVQSSPHQASAPSQPQARSAKRSPLVTPSATTKTSDDTATTPKAQKARPISGERPKASHSSQEDVSSPSSSGLKRRTATRSASSPLKTGAKKGFADRLRDAFRGESAGHAPPPLEYPSCSTVISFDDETETETDVSESTLRRSSGSRSPTTITYSDGSSYITDESSQLSKSSVDNGKRRPPTNGRHLLSTILSEADTFSSVSSDASSMISDTTVTQTTGFTRSTGTETRISRQRSRQSRNGSLKRRLTKHSDLVSVLSLPDEGPAPSRNQSLRSARSVRRSGSNRSNRNVDSLLRDFAKDESLYQRELKTLVDGVLPVLLTQVVKNDKDGKGSLSSYASGSRGDMLSKSVVDMGMALEKLRNAHKRCPLGNAHLLPQWLDTTHAVYAKYLDVWRLTFQGVIVNLRVHAFDDDDSLVNAMPQNEDGDVVNQDGERIDVAHLLKRPLVRIKWITKFIQGYRKIAGTEDYASLVSKWEALQDKARRRHKEEQARATDEEAINTDTSRCRDLRTLTALDFVRIDKFRQVYAKDPFSLELRHTRGQRLDCQIELVYRDNQLFKSDPGDLLIREIGHEGRTWLLFAPVLGSHCSARRGDDKLQLVVMIRGSREEWSELLILTAEEEEQVTDWLDILGTTPIPPQVPSGEFTEAQSRSLIAGSEAGDVPLGERRHRGGSRQAQSPSSMSPEVKARTPDRYHTRPDDDHERSRPLSESMRPDPAAFVVTQPDDEPEEDVPPPPPAHRSPSSKKQHSLAPPADDGRLKRRGSSPLKHEWTPSDVTSSDSSDYTSASGSETETEGEYSDSYDSSDDELEAVDMPETTPAISVKQHYNEEHHRLSAEEADVSLAPPALPEQQPPELRRPDPEYIFYATAVISYWDTKHGTWKDLWPEACTVITTPGLVEVYPVSPEGALYGGDNPLIALDLTPLVMLRNSTVLDLEIRSPVLSYARLHAKMSKADASFFRFRNANYQDSEKLYLAVHRARMDNAKYKALAEETRVRAFGQNQFQQTQEDTSSSRRRSWFGRKNSYRASARAPSQSMGSVSQQSSAVSASSFLKRLMGGASHSFDIEQSSIDKQPRSGSGSPSHYDSSASSATPPRSPSISAANSGQAKVSLATNNLKIRLHLLVSSSKWEDYGNCLLEVMRPNQGVHQKLRTNQGMEKRIVIRTCPRKSAEESIVVLDVVLGSRCFTRLGSRGILLNVWEEVKDETGATGMAPKDGGSGGQVNKWCFQCASVTEASWIFGLVTQEVMIG
ncbi:hypothetical protein Micbo1qcDRAFT_202912 [Microdochium bolleyi]|uniref:Uncharacterized protein n=1 Tax=Microdochium bolleyi TaxID=196109 RepID=A0A136J6A6_9PEZI|nr:hypothetical protein Micbo1qcDRAFT_202912 [Microdochium bolleyi]